MNEPKTNPRVFDIAEYSEKVRSSLKKLEQMQQPGQQSGKGSKTAVLEAAKDDIQELLKKGYTTKQIAEALSNDVFGIIPKTITQLTSGKTNSKKTKEKTRTKQPIKQATNTVAATKVQANVHANQQPKKPVTQLDDVE